MFQGIVQGSVRVTSVVKAPNLVTLAVELPDELAEGLRTGASVALDGVCLTVTHVAGGLVTFDLVQETLDRTTFKGVHEGSWVNVERSAKAGDEIGGHVLSGHVDTTATITKVVRSENNCVTTFRVDPGWMKYIFSKGFIALDGCSLTVIDVDKRNGTFTITLIPETLRVTTFGRKGEGDAVNVEIDRRTQVMVDTVKDFLRDLLAQADGDRPQAGVFAAMKALLD